MANCIEYCCGGFRLLATRMSYIFVFDAAPDPAPRPWTLGDGSVMRVGDRFTKLGGGKTCAAFTRLHLLRGWLEYAGTFVDPNGVDQERTAVLFRWSEVGDRLTFYGGFANESGALRLFYSTDAVAGRIIETSDVIRVAPVRGAA